VFVKVLDGENHFCYQEFCLFGREILVSLDQVEQVATWAEIKHEVQVVLGLKR
jgi:hypothetical protein